MNGPVRRRAVIVRVIARLNVGGPAIHVVNLTAGLDPRRFESVLVSGSENAGEGSMLDFALARGVRPVIIPEMVGDASLRPRDLRALASLYRVIRARRPQIVHTHTAKAGFLGRIAARLAGVPVVVHTYHGHILRGYYGPMTSGLLRRMEQALALMTDQIVAVSERVKQDLVDYGIAPPRKIAVIPLGFDLRPFAECAAYRGAFRRELGLPERARLVTIVGRIFPIKNHRLFLQAAALIAGADPEVHFAVVGDGALRAATEEYARTLGIACRVSFTGWRRDLPQIYADTDVLAVSSTNEGTPVSAIEAMAAGRPVVATRVGGLPDLIADGTTGFLVPPGDAGSLAAAILRILRDPDAAGRVGNAARAVAQARFPVERLLSDVEGLYARLLARKEGALVTSTE